MKRWHWVSLALALGLVATLLGFVLSLDLQRQAEQPAVDGAYIFDQPRPIQTAGIRSTGGESLQLPEYSGKWVLVNFGYLSCPDVCPTTLAHLSRLFSNGQGRGSEAEETVANIRDPDRLAVLFVTLDPARDTAERIETYLSHFSPHIEGFLGETAAIQGFARQLNTTFMLEAPHEGSTNYLVSHSNVLALLNPQGQFIAMLNNPVDGAHISRFLEEVTRILAHR